jgi:2-iminobutanoate/2-iminopropanoate deaminase
MSSSQSKTVVATPQAPAAIGPYSQAVRVGDTVYTSGQIALDPETGNFLAGSIAEQTERACENLKAVLATAGLQMTDVVKTLVFLKDMNDFTAMNEVYARYFAPEGAIAPARSTVQAARLPKDALVEIECVAKGEA